MLCVLHRHKGESAKVSNEGRAKTRLDLYPTITDWVAASADWLGSFTAQNRRERVHGFLGKGSLPLELSCGCDQVGTLKILTDKNGNLVKEVVRDSFGLQQHDSFPDLFMPIGFAGGLTDPDTGLVRFGYRDYDPAVGRFTALDPLGDTGGDHDLYEYCIDDPVTMNDPSGLIPFWPLLAWLFTGHAAALGIAGGDREGAAGLAAIERYLGAAALGSKYRHKIPEAMPHAVDFINGAFVPGPPAMTTGGVIGHVTDKLYKKTKEWK